MSRQGKRRYREVPHQHENDVDDLLVASEAVRSTWVQTKSPDPEDASVESTDVSITSDNGQSKCDDDDVVPKSGDISVASGNEVALGEDEDCELKDINPTNSANQPNVADIDIDATKDSDFQEPQNTSPDSGEDDDESDVDLSQEVVEDDDDARTSVKSTPRTHNEIDPFRCPTDQLRQLNVTVDPNAIESLRKGGDGSIILDEEIKTNLRLSGTVRTYLPEQRTVVVDSFIPFPLKSKNSCEISSPLDEGSLLVILTKEKNHGDQSNDLVSVETLSAEPCQVQILGPIMEVFGPVARPLYAIRLPDATKVISGTKEEKKLATIDDDEKDSNEIEISENEVEEPKETETDTRDEGDNQTPIDPWAMDGKLCKLLKSHPNVATFCLMNHAKLIDTDQVIRKSGKGCDASNIYDEEPGANEPQYFSDDEQERQSKRRNNKTKSSNRAGAQQRDRQLNEGQGGRGRGGRDTGRGRGRGRGPDGNRQYMHTAPYPQQHNHHWRPQHTQNGHPMYQNQYLPQGQHDQSMHRQYLPPQGQHQSQGQHQNQYHHGMQQQYQHQYQHGMQQQYQHGIQQQYQHQYQHGRIQQQHQHQQGMQQQHQHQFGMQYQHQPQPQEQQQQGDDGDTVRSTKVLLFFYCCCAPLLTYTWN